MGKSAVLARLVAVCAVTTVTAGGVLAGAPVSAQAPDAPSSSVATPDTSAVTPAAVRGDVKATCLRITIAGVTAGGRASVKVTGTKANKRYSKVINRSKTLRVAPGVYRVTAAPVAATGGTDVPEVATKKLRVRKNRCTGFTVRYTFVPSGPVVKTCASFAVGDTGPGGGMVFYVDMTRPTGSQCFEAAPSGWNTGGDPTADWCSNTSDLLGGTFGTTVGTGEANTALMVAAVSPGPCTSGAGFMADAYAGGGQTDWFLPSKDELNQVCRYASGQTFDATGAMCIGPASRFGGFTTSNYWSSSQGLEGNAWGQDFAGGSQKGNAAKEGIMHVRPVRAF